MDRDKAQEPLVVPEWVKGLFKDVSVPSPAQTTSLVSRDELMLSTASRQVTEDQTLVELFKDSPNKLKTVRQRMAENLITLGMLEEAKQFADDPALQSRIKSYIEAMNIPDDQFCSCEDDMAGNVPLSRMRVVQRIYAPEYGQMVDVKQCHKCLFTNATDVKTDTENTISDRLSKAGEGDSDEKVFK